MTKPLAYVCSPYIGDSRFNSQKAKEYSRKIYDAGFNPLAPEHILSHYLADRLPKDPSGKKDFAQVLLRGCRVIVMCGDVVTSEMSDDLGLAARLNIVYTSLNGVMDVAKCLGVKQ